MKPGNVALAFTGASGAPYGLRLLETLLKAGREVHLMVSTPGRLVINTETDWNLPADNRAMRELFCERFQADPELLHIYGKEQWMAPIASGSNAPEAMVICPCTTATLSAVATGASRSLIERAADVALKEKRKLILVIRETPFSEIHLENMLKLARMGAVIMPANPGFYHRPDSVDGLVDYMVARVLDHLGVENSLMPRWSEA
ncbi:MAG: flavin prenyltransferase UbiX [Gammaproteobacteria bacterium]